MPEPAPVDGPELAGVPARKRQIRADLLACRRSVTPAGRAEADLTLRELVHGLLKPGMTVTAYVPTPGEPGGPSLPAGMAQAVAPGQVLLPIVEPDLDLEWAPYTGEAHLRPARLGLREPDSTRLGHTGITQATLLIVPALAVDRTGVRLGRGGGCYDRALARVKPGTPVVALLYDGEFVDELPAAPHDQRVTAVITPAGGLVAVSPARM